MISGDKGCANCRFCMSEQQGYSEWTITGYTYTCLKGLHPEMPFDDEVASAADVDRVMEFGVTCSGRVEGDGPYFGLDGVATDEEVCGGDSELLALLKAARAR